MSLQYIYKIKNAIENLRRCLDAHLFRSISYKQYRKALKQIDKLERTLL